MNPPRSRKIELLLLVLALCVVRVAAADDKYQLKDSQKNLDRLARIYWVDDHRVLFAGRNGKHVTRPDGFKVLLQSLYLWNVDTGDIQDQGEIGAGLCYAAGYVRYRKWKEKAVGISLGEFVAGKLGSGLRPAPELTGVRIDTKTCQPLVEDPPLPDWTMGKAVRRLRAEHGFLVLGPEKPELNTLVTYHPKGDPNGVLMPFKRREARLAAINYVPFKSAYFIEGDYFVPTPQHPLGGYNKSPWPKGTPIPIWWLYPDGRIEQMKLPTETRFGIWIFPAKTGVFFISPAQGYDGLFQIKGDSVTRIVTGFIEGFSVSPDGCRIALNHDGSYKRVWGGATLKTINTCTQGG